MEQASIEADISIRECSAKNCQPDLRRQGILVGRSIAMEQASIEADILHQSEYIKSLLKTHNFGTAG
jgi:hypothetical protein